MKKLHDEEARIDRSVATKCKEKNRGREETLISVSVYHIMNNTYIHLMARGPNIYMYRRGRIYKESLKKYNNRKMLIHI
jgi:hypothetical protein